MKALRLVVILGLSVLVFTLFSMFSLKWNSESERLSLKTTQESAYALDTSDCRCCHGTVVDRHHRLATRDQYPCMTCHEMAYDPITQEFNPMVQRECTVCHIVGVSLDDRHHVQVQQQNLTCFTCHQMILDPVTDYYYVTLNRACDAAVDGSSVDHYSSHNVAPGDCTTCHLNNLIDVHALNPLGCDLCHLGAAPAVQGAVQSKDTACTACHTPSLPHPAPAVPTDGKVTGSVTTTSGVGISGATVYMGAAYATTTASDGSYTLSVPTGSYDVRVTKTGYLDKSISTTIAAGQTVTVNFNLTALGTISGRVKTVSGVGISGAAVYIGAAYVTTTASDGSYSLTVVPGTYAVSASSTGYDSSSITASVTAGQTTTADITLMPPAVTTGSDFSATNVASSTGGSTMTLSGSYTIGAGTNRLLLVMATWETGNTGDSANVTTATYGGQALTQLSITPSGARNRIYIGYLKETGIAAASGTTLTVRVTSSSSPASGILKAGWFSGVDQTTPVNHFVRSSNENPSGTTHNFGAALNVVSGGRAYYFETANQTTTYTAPAGYTERYDGNDPNNNFSSTSAFKNITTTGTENPTITQNSSNRYSLTAVSLKPAQPNPGSIQLSSSVYSVSEAGPTVTITATRTGGSTGAAGVSFATSNGTAAAGSDYTATSGTLSWADGDTASKTFTVLITQDTLDEGNETFTVTLSSPTGGATLGSPGSATVTITDDDATPAVQWTAASQASANESGTMTVTAQLSAASGQTVTVPFTVTGTATGGGTDYTITASPITITAGSTTGTATITIVSDAFFEGNETVILTMGTPTNATPGATTVHTATITNDDAAPIGTIALSSATYSVGEAGPTVTIKATRIGGSTGAVGVSYATSNGTATAGSDYTATSGTLNWANGDTTNKTFTVPITQDNLVEDNQTFTVKLSSPTGGATLGSPSSATVTITDDDTSSGWGGGGWRR